MNVSPNLHNFVMVGILAALFLLLARLATKTPLVNVPFVGHGLTLLAGGGA